MLSLRLVADGLDLAALENRFGSLRDFRRVDRQVAAGNLESMVPGVA